MKNVLLIAVSMVLVSSLGLALTNTDEQTTGTTTKTTIAKKATTSAKATKATKKDVKKPAANTGRVRAAKTKAVPAKPISKKAIANKVQVAQASTPVQPYKATPPSQTPMSIPSSTSDTTAGTVSAPIQKIVKESTPSPFGVKIRSYNQMYTPAFTNRQQTSGGAGQPPSNVDGEVQDWLRVNFTYNFTPNVSFSVMPQYFNTWFGDRDRPSDTGGYSQPYAGFMGNTGLILSDSKLATLKGGIVWDGLVRYDIPTSEASQLAGSNGEVWVGTALSKSLGKFDLKYSEIGRYYMQNYTTSSVLGPDGLPALNMQLRIYSLLDIGYNFTSKFSFTLESGFMNDTTYGDNSTNRPAVFKDRIVVNPDATYAFSDAFALSLGFWEDGMNMRALESPYVPLYDLNGDNTVYLQVTIKL